MKLKYRDAFIMVECTLGLVLCALALGIVFAFMQYMSHRLALLQSDIASGADMFKILSAPVQDFTIQTSHRIYEVKHYTYHHNTLLPYTLHYFAPVSVR